MEAIVLTLLGGCPHGEQKRQHQNALKLDIVHVWGMRKKYEMKMNGPMSCCTSNLVSISIIWDSANSFYASTIRHVLEEQLLEIWHKSIFPENCDILLEMTFIIWASVRVWIRMLICCRQLAIHSSTLFFYSVRAAVDPFSLTLT